MTYDDIITWAEEFVSSDRFDDFGDWDRAVKANFKLHKHVFPEGMTSTLAEYWEEKYETLAEESEEEAEETEIQRQRQKQTQRAQQFRERAVSAPREIVRRESISRSLRVHHRERIAERRKEKRQKFEKRLSKAERKRKRGIGR